MQALGWLEAGWRFSAKSGKRRRRRVREGQQAKGSSCGSGSSGGGGNGQAVEAAHALASALCSVAEVCLRMLAASPKRRRSGVGRDRAMSLIARSPRNGASRSHTSRWHLSASRSSAGRGVRRAREGLRLLKEADEANPPSFDLRLSCAKLLMEVEQPAEAVELLQALRLEHDDHLEAWYLLGCAAMQAGDASFALHEAEAACAFAKSDACPSEEREWLAQLEELREEAAAAAEGEMPE